MDALDQINKRRTIADLESHVETEFSFRTLADLDHLQGSGHVHRHGLFKIDMLSPSDDGFQVLRMIIRRRCDHHGVYLLGGRHLFEGFGTNEGLRSINC